MNGHPEGEPCMIIKVTDAATYKVGDVFVVGKFWPQGTRCIMSDGHIGLTASGQQELIGALPKRGSGVIHPVAWMIPMPKDDEFENGLVVYEGEGVPA